jgi:hypothetical protein
MSIGSSFSLYSRVCRTLLHSFGILVIEGIILFITQVYNLYEFLLLVLFMLFFVTGCISVVFSYTLLNSEDYRWSWPVFITSGFSAVYIFIYSILYFFSVTKYLVFNCIECMGCFRSFGILLILLSFVSQYFAC